MIKKHKDYKITMNDKNIKNLWFKFFKSKQHFRLPSFSLIPINDPTLLWINSGISTLKLYFEGRQIPPASNLVSCQRAIRTSDIENIGNTARHLSFFEMLGNFSIGGYFKKEAILYAWEFLTSPIWLGLDPNKMYITVYKEDQISYDIWLNIIKIPKPRIIKKGKDENFWQIGQGPCGPNSEIFYDRGLDFDPDNQGPALLINDIENDRYLEIWNIVFSEFNYIGNNEYKPLPCKNIDTGAGYERIATILENKRTVFETKLFLPIIKKLESIINNSSFIYQPNNNNLKQKSVNYYYRVIADHIRTCTFAIADGVFPSNKDRGYIIRRLIRRALVHAIKMGINQPILYKLVNTIININKDYYLHLEIKKNIVINNIKNEEVNFFNTLKSGIKILKKTIS